MEANPLPSGGFGGFIIHYLPRLTRPKLILWFYLCWYLTMAGRYFDPSPALWISSLGIAAIITL